MAASAGREDHGSEGWSDGEQERTSDVHHPEILGDAGTVRQHVRHEREVHGHVDAVTQTSCLSSGAALVGITAAVVLFGLQLL